MEIRKNREGDKLTIEIEGRIDGLREDSIKAKEYLKLRQRYKELEINIILKNIENLELLLQEGLTPLQKEIFNLVTHEGFDYEDIAKHLSMSVEAVRMNMSRTRKKIRENYKRLNR